MMSRFQLISAATLLFGLIFSFEGSGQQGFAYMADIDTVSEAGFRSIPVTPAIASKCQPSLADLRIMDASGKAVPYIINTSLPSFLSTRFASFPLLRQQTDRERQTHVEFENPDRLQVENLVLSVRNADVERRINISGSDDGNNWYVIREGIPLEFQRDGKTTAFDQPIPIPLSNYRYFRISQAGKNVPVNISKAGSNISNYAAGKWMELPAPVTRQFDSSNNHSYVSLDFNAAYEIDKLELRVNGPKFFKRNVMVYVIGGKEPIARSEIRSDNPFVVQLSQRANALLLEIVNDDNTPLTIAAAKAYQLNRQVIAYLEGGKKYRLYFGDTSAAPPRYDMIYFRDSVPAMVSTIGIGQILANDKSELATIAGSGYKEVLVWLMILVALLLLLFLSYRMVRELKRRSAG